VPAELTVSRKENSQKKKSAVTHGKINFLNIGGTRVSVHAEDLVRVFWSI
jgi:hypothetical protein